MDLEKIKLRLKSLGYEVVEGDEVALEFAMDDTEKYIKHYCNIDIIPDCLDTVFIDIACGRFLQAKKSTGQLTSMQVEQVVKEIRDGDTTVQFATGKDSETIFNTFVDKLINGHDVSLIRHRQLCW